MLMTTLPRRTPEIAVTGLDNPSWIRRAMLLEQIAEAYADGTFGPAQRRQGELRAALETAERDWLAAAEALEKTG